MPMKLSQLSGRAARDTSLIPKARAFLAKAPVDTVYTTPELADALRCSQSAIKNEMPRKMPELYCLVLINGRMTGVWGSERTIARLVKKLGR